jgi:AcrR family transcriptional regulator
MRRAKPYHHGNLREALLEAAVRLIAEVGPTAFTLREVARRAGVSHNAPYRHFHDRDDLMAAVAAQGFRELTRAMIEAAAGKSDALERLKRAGLGYVTFALRRPEHFTVMFDAPASTRKHPGSAAASEEAFAILLGFVRTCQESGHLASGDLREMALLAWTMVHGIAKLAITGRLPFGSRSEVLRFAEFVIDQSLAGGRTDRAASSLMHIPEKF